MIKTERLTIKGEPYIRTYSSKKLKIEREGVVYEEAIDLERYGREYSETDIPIDEPEEVEE